MKRALGLTASDLKLLNPLVAGIGDVEMAVAVEGHAVRVDELAGVTAGASEAEQEFAVGGEALHAIVQAADPHAVVSVEHDADGPECVLQVAEVVRAEAARLVSFVAPQASSG